MIIGGSGSEKTNTLISLIKEQDYKDAIDKIYLYAKDLNEPKYQFLIEKHEYAGIKHKMIQLHILSVQILWMMFTRTLIITIQKETAKF